MVSSRLLRPGLSRRPWRRPKKDDLTPSGDGSLMARSWKDKIAPDVRQPALR
jgi:hypothetical protein